MALGVCCHRGRSSRSTSISYWCQLEVVYAWGRLELACLAAFLQVDWRDLVHKEDEDPIAANRRRGGIGYLKD